MQANPDETRPPTVKCPACGTVMMPAGTEQFRIGGTSGLWKLFFGELAELGETMMPFEVWVCRSCRHVELRVPPEYETPAEEARGLRYACPGCGGDVYHGQAACPTCGRPLTD